MTDQSTDALGEAVSAMFATLAEQYQPAVDLVPTALAQAQRGVKRRRLAWSVGGGVVTAAAAVAVAVIATMSGGVAVAPAGGGGATPTVQAIGLNPACVGKWLPWTSGSDASLFGKGTDAQRAVVCSQDIATLKTILPGATITPDYETFGHGARTEFTPDQIAKLGAGTDPNTHILKPWQYTVTVSGHSGYFFVSYSAARTDLCGGCDEDTSQTLPGPPGYRLVQKTSATGSQQQHMNEDLIETPKHTYLGVGVSPVTGGTFVPPVDVSKLVHDGRFVAALDADLVELYGH
jgi:hypothetical protein